MPVVSDLSAPERTAAVADLLATALLRIFRPVPAPPSPPAPGAEASPESLSNPLAVLAGTSVTVHAG
jgi:hypothetical protein